MFLHEEIVQYIKGYYEQDVTRHPGWKLVRIYADEGISGTSLSHREEFKQMMDDGVTEGLGLMAAIEKYREFVPDVHFELIPIKDLVSNQQYQRKLSLRHVDNAAAEFNVYEINPVKVSRRDGINYVFDGQHTAEIVAKESGSRDTPVWCMVYDGLDYKLEAYVFANQKKFARTLTPYEIFMANVEAEEETELTIKALAESYSLTITNKSKTNGGLCAISALEFIFRKYGYHAWTGHACLQSTSYFFPALTLLTFRVTFCVNFHLTNTRLRIS